MNRAMNKRWGKKLLLFFCVLISFSCVITIPTIYNKEVKAETTEFDDEPLGEKIVDIAVGNNGYTFYALTTDKQIYAWGKGIGGHLGNGAVDGSVSTPQKVLNSPDATDGNYYLGNIKKIYAGGNGASGWVFAVTTDGELYAWGDNRAHVLGLPKAEIYPLPTKVELSFKVKDIATGQGTISLILSENNDVYVCGTGSYLGLMPMVTQADSFTKLEQDTDGNPLPPIKEIATGAKNTTLLTEDGRIFSFGDSATGTNGMNYTNSHVFYPTLAILDDSTVMTDVVSLFTHTAIADYTIVRRSDGELYISGISRDYKNHYSLLKKYSAYSDLNDAFQNADYMFGTDKGAVFESGGKAYYLRSYGGDGFNTFAVKVVTEIKLDNLPLEYNNVIKAESGGINNPSDGLVLTNKGSVYQTRTGKKIAFGDIIIKGIKQDNKTYVNKEKYNDNVMLSISSSHTDISQLVYTETDLITGSASTPQKATSTLNVEVLDTRIFKKYKYYKPDEESKIYSEFIIDLYKKTPSISDVTNNGKYKAGKSFTISDNGFSGNTVSAKLTDSEGTITDYISGTPINILGNYKLSIEDQYGNTNEYFFTITDQPVAESVSFTPTDENGLVYGNTITKAGSVIGTLSLVYADGDTPSTIKTLTIGTDQDGAKFEKSGTNQLKVKGTDLSAGTYTVPVSGTDQNDMPFSGEITIVIAKAASTMAWNNDTQSLSTDGLTLGKEVTLGVKDQPSGTTVTYGMKASNSCITLDSSTGKVKATCVPSPASVTFTATPTGNDNYNLSALELTVPIKKQSVTLNIEMLDSDASYKNDVSIKIGDELPTVRISSTDPALDVSALGTPTYMYNKGSVEVSNPNITEGIYTVSAAYPSGSPAENYDITWNTATLRVNGITIDENNESDYFTLTSDGKSYTQGTWTNKAIIITPVHDTFNQIDINDVGNKTTNAYTYNTEGSETVKLSFYNSDGAKVSTTVTLNYDKTAPTISKFNYEEESGVRSFLRTITFDHFFGKAQQLSFTGSDETGGSGLDHYRYEIVELDKDKNELPASKKTGTLGLSEKVSLDINTSYRISAWAIDIAGNESDEKIERVFLSDEVAQLNITATSEGKNYDGTNWTKSGVSVTLSSTSSAGVEKYQYSSDGVVFHDMSGATITLPDPISDVDNVTYTFKAIHNDRTESEKTLNLKVDTVKPELNVTGTVNGSTYDGSLVDQNIEIAMNQTNTNISGTTYYYTTSPTSKDSDPTTDSNWKRYTTPMTHSANGTFTYYFKAISGAGIVSDTKEYTVKLAKKEYTNITVNVTSEGKNYSPGNWAKGDITFTLSGGLKDTTQITGYEYTTTNGSIPSSSATWKPVTNKTVKLIESIKDQTYWFRVTPVDPDGKISAGTKVNLDVDAPSIPTMSLEELNNTKLAELINTLSFGSWMNKQAEVTMTSSDTTSGIDHYEYIETMDGVEAQPKTSSGTIIYKDEVELTIKARACDKAGNCSAYTSAEELKIDRKAPTIIGVKDQSEYKQYYTPRFVTVTDLVSGLKQATYKKDNTPAGTFTDNVETPIKGEGSYEIYAIDEAGNEITITFKILKLPNIETEIDGSDESREIIDQIIKEYEEVKDKIDQNEKDNYEQWIKDAEEKWDSLRTKVIEDNETTSKVEGQGDTTFDPKTELIVEEIPKDKVPVLPRNAIKTYDVYLKKGNTIIQPDGSVKVYLPYTEEEPPIVYEIGEDGTIKELPAQQEDGYVTFITDTLKKYAISNEKQKENKPDVCVVGPDGKLDSQDDVCGSDDSKKNEDGSVTVPEGGKVIFPDKEINAPDGAIINPDGSVDFPDGTHFDPDGNETTKPDPKPDPNPNPDDKNDQVCVAGPDGKLGSDDDVCGEENGEGVPPVKEPDGSVTVPEGGSVIFPDGSEVELPDGGIIKPDGSVVLPDGTEYNPDGTKKEPDDKEPNKKECTLIEKKELNIDTDGDGLPDINLDINGDCKPELNIDVNGDNVPDIDIDTTGNGKADINIDTNKDGKPDLNIVLNLKWKPNVTYTVNGFTYNSMKNLIPDLNVDDDGNGSPDRNIDTDGDNYPDVNVDDDWYSKRGLKDPNKNTVQGSYTSNSGGASTSDHTKWSIWLITFIITIVTMLYTLKRKQKNIQ